MNASIERWWKAYGGAAAPSEPEAARVELSLVCLRGPTDANKPKDYDPKANTRRARSHRRNRADNLFGGRLCCGATADSIQRKIDRAQVRLPHVELCSCGAIWLAKQQLILGGRVG